jgi:hypothetical protein
VSHLAHKYRFGFERFSCDLSVLTSPETEEDRTFIQTNFRTYVTHSTHQCVVLSDASLSTLVVCFPIFLHLQCNQFSCALRAL